MKREYSNCYFSTHNLQKNSVTRVDVLRNNTQGSKFTFKRAKLLIVSTKWQSYKETKKNMSVKAFRLLSNARLSAVMPNAYQFMFSAKILQWECIWKHLFYFSFYICFSMCLFSQIKEFQGWFLSEKNINLNFYIKYLLKEHLFYVHFYPSFSFFNKYLRKVNI